MTSVDNVVVADAMVFVELCLVEVGFELVEEVVFVGDAACCTLLVTVLVAVEVEYLVFVRDVVVIAVMSTVLVLVAVTGTTFTVTA